MRRLALALPFILIATPLLAVDLGKAAGAMTVDGNRIELTYAYAIGHQKNELNNRSDDTRVVLTSQPLPPDVKLSDIDYSFPDGTMGLVVCITRTGKISHVVVQHPHGMYDAGYFDNVQDYQYKPDKSDSGTIAGKVTSAKITTNTMTFSFDVDFDAAVK